jgi:maltose O-acetyltransferase
MTSARNRVFWVVQGLLKYVAFDWCVSLRRVMYRPFFAHAGRHLTIHDGVLIKFPDEIRFGHEVTVSPGCILVGRGGLSIGNDVMIGAGSKIVTTSHETDRTDIPMRLQGLSANPIVIEDDVWLGFDTKVLPGVTIRRGAIVGAGSVVVDEIAAWSVAAGAPARVVGARRQ